MQAVTSYSNDNDETTTYLRQRQAAHLHKRIESKFHRTTFRALLLTALPSSNSSRRIRIRMTDHLCRLVQRCRGCRVHTPLMYPVQRLGKRNPFSLALMRFRPGVSSTRLAASRWLCGRRTIPHRDLRRACRALGRATWILWLSSIQATERGSRPCQEGQLVTWTSRLRVSFRPA